MKVGDLLTIRTVHEYALFIVLVVISNYAALESRAISEKGKP